MDSDTTFPTAKQRGRPREFDAGVALDKALEVFAKQGYHGTSITDLTEAMGLTSGSVYKAFKDKRGIFIAAFDHHRVRRQRQLAALLGGQASGRDRLLRLLMNYAGNSCEQEGRNGCIVVGSAAELALFDAEIADRVAAALDHNEKQIADLIAAGKADGSIPAHIDESTTARLLLCLTSGMRVIGKTGRSQQDMAAVANAALRLLT
jgi:AcrR family transcriptional regulator